MNCMELLRGNSVFWSKLGFCYDPPRLGKDGKPIVFFDNWEQVRKYHRDFYNAGIRIHSCIVFTGWVGVGRYDYELTDRVLDSVFSCGDDLLFIPRIKLNVPLEWSRENPEELCVYYNGPRDAGSIRALVGTAKHDLLGYQSAKGYYTAGGWQDDRPNLDGVISNQSFSSQKWLADAGEALRRLIRHIEDGPYGRRIPAYHIAYGASGESCVWGRCNISNSADYGIANRRNFYAWGLRQYRSAELLGKIWMQPGVGPDTLVLPSPEQKEGETGDLCELFRMKPEDKICIDYDRFTAESNVSALEHFGRIVKMETGGKAVGAFYGYFLEVARSAYTGYTAMEQLLHSPYIDFLAAPKRDGGGEMCPAQSVNRRKQWMDELDNRTCIARGTGIEHKSADFAETRSIMWREFAKNLSHGSSFWWMDLGGGWYDSPVLLDEITRIERMAKQLRRCPAESISEILVVADEEMFFHQKTSYYLHHCLFPRLIDAMNRTGAPWDFYRRHDLPELDLRRYRLIVFANPFAEDAADFAQSLESRLSAGTTLVWNYAPGFLRNGEGGIAGCERFLGHSLSMRIPDFHEPLRTEGALAGTEPLVWPEHTATDVCPRAENCPVLYTEDCAKPLARWSDGKIAVFEWEKNGLRNVFCGAPLLQAAHYRRLLADAGGKLPAPQNVLVYGDSRFLFFFAWENCSFDPSEAVAGCRFEAVRNELPDHFGELNLKQYESRFFLQEKVC